MAAGAGGVAEGVSMPGMAAGVAAVAVGAGITMPGIGSLVLSAPGGVGGMSMPRIAGMAGDGELAGVSRLVTWCPACRAGRAGTAFFLAGGFGLAGMVMPGIAMPPICWAGAMAGSNATAAAVACHLILIINKTPGKE